MSEDWWSAAPISKPAGGDNWWSAAPVVSPAKKEPEVSFLGKVGDVAKSAVGGIGRGLTGFLQAAGNPTSQFTASPQEQALERKPDPGLAAIEGAMPTPKTTPGKYAASAGEAVGNPMSYLGPGGMLAKGAAAVTGGLGSELAGQATNDSILGRIVGGAVGSMAPSTLLRAGGRAVTLAPMKPDQARLVQTLRAAGIEPTAGQASGNRALKYAESRLGEQLGAGGATEAANERVSKEFNRWAFKQAGETADRATPDVMARMWGRLGNRFEQLTARNTLQADVPMWQRMQSAYARYMTEVPPTLQVKAVEKLMDDVENAINNRGGNIGGEVYQSYRSQLARLARGAKENPELRQIYREMTDSLDDAMERTLAASKSSDLGAFREVRGQYHNAMLIDKAIGVGAKGEEITPNKLRNALQQEDRKGFHTGRGDMAEVTHAADMVLAPLPDSGTAAREAFNSPLKFLGQLPMGWAGRALHSDPIQAWLKNQGAAQYLRNLGPARYPTLAARGGLVAGTRPSPEQQYLETVK